jgi:hypothetical protein
VVAEKAAFRIKFEVGPVDEITTYKADFKEISKFSSDMGLMTTNIES